jgi:hypothetical protein
VNNLHLRVDHHNSVKKNSQKKKKKKTMQAEEAEEGEERSWLLLKTNYDRQTEIILGVIFAAFALLGKWITV